MNQKPNLSTSFSRFRFCTCLSLLPCPNSLLSISELVRQVNFILNHYPGECRLWQWRSQVANVSGHWWGKCREETSSIRIDNQACTKCELYMFLWSLNFPRHSLLNNLSCYFSLWPPM